LSNRVGHNAVDYIHSSENVVYSDWVKTFVLLPVTTIHGNKVWFRNVYRRRRKLLADIPQFPVNALDRVQYATIDEIIERRLKGLP